MTTMNSTTPEADAPTVAELLYAKWREAEADLMHARADRDRFVEALHLMLREASGERIELGHHSSVASAVRALLQEIGEDK